MTPSEEYYLKVRHKLDGLGYLQPLSFESVLLVDKILEELLLTKKNLQHYKNVAQQSIETCSELQAGVGPYKEDNTKLLKENNELRQKLLKARESVEDTKIGPTRKIDTSKANKDQLLEVSQEKINNLTKQITKLKCEQQELDEIIESLKNKVNVRDAEIERLVQLLKEGRPLMAPVRNLCPCCSPQLLDCRLLTKNKELSEQLEDSKQKQHEAMVRAVELAEKTQLLQNQQLPSARSDNSRGSKKCCCAENSARISSLQEKLEERILQVDSLEKELAELKKSNAEAVSEKCNANKLLEITLEDKKKMNDRINELTIIERDLMLEIERLKRTNATQKSQLAEMEEKVAALSRVQQDENRVKPPERKSLTGTQKSSNLRKTTLHSNKGAVISKPLNHQSKITKQSVTKKVVGIPMQQSETESSTLSSTSAQLSKRSAQLQPQSSVEKSHPDHSDPHYMLLERVQAERDYYYKEFSRLRDQLCNIPDHTTEVSRGPPSPHQKLERLLTERDYYHKEMCRLLEAVDKPKTAMATMEQQLAEKQDKINVLQGKLADAQHKLTSQDLNSEMLKKISAKEEDIKVLSQKITELECQLSSGFSQSIEDLRRRLNLKEEEILNLREILKTSERPPVSYENQQCISELVRRLNLKEEEILNLREKNRNAEKNHVPFDLSQRNEDLWRRLNLKEDELLKMQEKIKNLEEDSSKYLSLKKKYNFKEEEVLCLKEQIRELESNRCNNIGLNQGAVRRLEADLEAAQGDCIRLREENNALRNDIQDLKDNTRTTRIQKEQEKLDFERCVSQFEVERQGFNFQIKQLNEDLRACQEKTREMQGEISDQRSRSNQLKLSCEHTDRELRTTQDLLHQTEAQLASALDRVQEVNEQVQALEWQLKEARQECSCLRANMMRLDQEKDTVLLKVDEKTEQLVRIEGELDSRDRRIASLEGFVADLQKKLDVALDTAARSEQTSRQMTQDNDRLRKDIDKAERVRANALKENSRLQDDLAAITVDHQQLSRCLEASKRKEEDLKLQLQGYVAEVRRTTDILEEKEAERMAMLEQYRSLSAESAHLESNNHTLASEARSTRTRIHDLEALVHAYEKQIKELSYQVAKLERKLESKAKSDSANKDLTRELESQKHILEKRVDQLTCVNKQLEEEVAELRAELSHLKEQLGKERKNSATLGDMLNSTKQETLQRARDNSELKGQVQCLQGKLRELRSKLEHGSEALQRCETECEDYQAQVVGLRKELHSERTERTRQEANRSYSSTL